MDRLRLFSRVVLDLFESLFARLLGRVGRLVKREIVLKNILVLAVASLDL